MAWNMVAVRLHRGMFVIGADPDRGHAHRVGGLEVAGDIFQHHRAGRVYIVFAHEGLRRTFYQT